MCILNHHDRIIHDNPQPEEQGEEHDEVEGDIDTGNTAYQWDKEEGYKHTQGHTQGHKEGIRHTHKEHQDQQHEYETDNDRIDQFVERSLGLLTGIPRKLHP